MRLKHFSQAVVGVTIVIAVMFTGVHTAYAQVGNSHLPQPSPEPDATSEVVDGASLGTGIGDRGTVDESTNDPAMLRDDDIPVGIGTGVTTSADDLSFDPAKNIKGLTSIKRLTFLQSGKDPLSITINLVNTALGFLGIISTILLAYAGILWFTARGNDEQVEKAKELIKGSLIGLVLTLMALGISITIFNLVADITTSEQSIIETSGN